MKDKWLDEIRNKVDGMEMKEPAGLWDAIEMRQSYKKSKRQKTFSAMRLFTAAASVATVIGLGYMFLFNGSNEIDMSVKDMPLTAVSSTWSTKSVITRKTESIAKASIPKRHVDTANLAGTEDTPCNSNSSTDKVTQGSEERSAANQAENTSPEELPMKSEIEEAHYRHRNREESGNGMKFKTQGKRQKSNLSIGVFISGTFTSSTNNNPGIGRFAISDQLYDSDDDVKSQVVRSRAVNKTDNRKVSAKHHQPLRFGLTIRYNFTPRIGLESGVMYSKLRSDFREGEDDSYFSGEQTLHYIGIPLNFSYRILSWKKFDLYTSAGIMGEKCVSGRLKGHKVENGNIGEQKSSHLHESGFQFSANASAGIQFRVNNTLGIYAEPGVSYYFDNGSNLQTIYKDRKTNFNLNLGLRFNFGTK